MSVDIEALVNRLGDTYDDGLIPYKSAPDGGFDDDVVTLDMKKEYIFLAFEYPSKILKSITITIPSNMRNQWKFPNEIPFGLKQVMTEQWLYEHLGSPIRSAPEEQIMGVSFGKMEVFKFKNESLSQDIAISCLYGFKKVNVKEITFESLEQLNNEWKQ